MWETEIRPSAVWTGKSFQCHYRYQADKEVKILLGDTNGATGDCYMAVEGAGKVYTVDATFQTLFSNGLTAMRPERACRR